MEYMQGTGGFFMENETAITLGKFDGLHRGHQKLIRKIKEYGARGCKAVVFTLNSMAKGQILTEQERKDLAARMGVDVLIDCPLVSEITSMEPEDFVREILVRQLHGKYLVVGADFRFGYQRKGDTKLLMKLQKKYGFYVDVIKKQQYHDRDISSSYIREELASGHIGIVNELLGYPFFVSGEVLHERTLGGQLGVPTTNLIATTRKLLPPDGVYATKTVLGKQSCPSITNIGTRPSGEKSFRGVETYLFDFEEDLFGENIEVQFLNFMRPEMKFDSAEALKEQMRADTASRKEYFCE